MVNPNIDSLAQTPIAEIEPSLKSYSELGRTPECGEDVITLVPGLTDDETNEEVLEPSYIEKVRAGQAGKVLDEDEFVGPTIWYIELDSGFVAAYSTDGIAPKET